MRPVTILGAGPAGLAAAVTLAAGGRAVEVHERRPDCGARFGGDLQGLENFSGEEDALDELARLGLGGDFHAAPFVRGMQTDGRRVDTFAFARPIFYLVRRGGEADTIDQALKRRAIGAGVRLHFGSTLAAGAADIVATGPRGRRAYAVCRGFAFRTDAPDVAVVLLDDRAGYKGYSYLLVTDGHGCLCTSAFAEFGRVRANLAAARATLLGRWPMRVEAERPVGGAVHFSGRPRWRDGDALVVGEAAGLQDFLWAFGLRAALRSGALAARALLEGSDYAGDAERRFTPLVRGGVVNRFLWEVGRAGRYALPRLALRRAGGGPLMEAMYRYHPVQRLLYPVARAWVRAAHPHLTV